MTYKTIDPSTYEQQLAQKVQRLTAKLAAFDAPALEVFPSPQTHYRMRAEFRVWHEGDDLYYIMFNPETREKIRMDEFVPGSRLINQLMQQLIERLKPNDILRRKLFQVDFLTTSTQQAVISLLYHRPLDDQWQQHAEQLRSQLEDACELECLHIIGRARKQKRVLESDTVTDKVNVAGRDYWLRQTENSFTQPNHAINEAMLAWADKHTQSSDGDLLELYCGNGNFTIPLARNFTKVLATEISKSSVAAARENAALNKVDNVTVVRMSAEDFTAALKGEKTSQRIAEAQLEQFSCRTVLVDPPRAGLDEQTLALVANYDTILYISCNPDTLSANLATLCESHDVAAAALFDQFPYTEHMESGVLLRRRSS
ncbi:tRNA (uridine(54)-C5)-methyltransferase TrmA [Idiomarina tyrosinivorans]|uniref:tRNA/tmRNA (uracil-C(5))-methyltransferase n=1 Tax=Idiomarina tyrosinivorans TaxID=1445662 RepID=A0A432ZFC1_9GAMM|nr:tRNA (uridine(54)-C5)-methyltransferase TrmA [Idiomarina tyrosinivorans]RUO76621.1 tRNA (uridine(54)-C5)-methyltransferase TrmA [Idiomarina tyrosinivorans]